MKTADDKEEFWELGPLYKLAGELIRESRKVVWNNGITHEWDRVLTRKEIKVLYLCTKPK